MAYFSNGSEGEILDNQCAECIHKDPTALCPIAEVQLEFNYDQCNESNKDLKRAMTMLINDKGMCQMKQWVDKRKTRISPLKRPLKFGDDEQIAALKVMSRVER